MGKLGAGRDPLHTASWSLPLETYSRDLTAGPPSRPPASAARSGAWRPPDVGDVDLVEHRGLVGCERGVDVVHQDAGELGDLGLADDAGT